VTGSERAKTVHALDRAATVTGSERAKTVHALDRAATVTGPVMPTCEYENPITTLPFSLISQYVECTLFIASNEETDYLVRKFNTFIITAVL
jgi:hypothetical protein